MNQPIRIAMWSGPRNISTAMMRSWGNRQDTFVIDEPFYPYYLYATGKNHPGADEVIAAGETDWSKVVGRLTGPVPNGRRIFFQKQMTHHLLPGMDREWLAAVTNCFLIRDPREVIASYVKKREHAALEDLGFVQQMEIFDFVCARTNTVPAVVVSMVCVPPVPTTTRSVPIVTAWPAVVMSDRSVAIAPGFRGRQASVRRTGFGPSIGTVRSPGALHSARIGSEIMACRSGLVQFTSAVVNATTDCISTGYNESARRERNIDFFPAFLVS